MVLIKLIWFAKSKLYLIISLWTSFFLQNRNRPIIEFLIFFNDLTIILIIILITSFTFIFFFLKIIKRFSLRFPERQRLEDLWLCIPIVFLIFIGFPRIKNLYICEEFNESDLSLKIKGHQWYWRYEVINLEFDSILNKEIYNFRLLETFNHLILPIKCLIRVLISSEDVIHSWTIPSLGVKIDAIPGRISQIIFIINRPGLLTGQCREICGTNHSFMPIIISANSLNKFLS